MSRRAEVKKELAYWTRRAEEVKEELAGFGRPDQMLREPPMLGSISADLKRRQELDLHLTEAQEQCRALRTELSARK